MKWYMLVVVVFFLPLLAGAVGTADGHISKTNLREEVETVVGRKLVWHERIALKIAAKQVGKLRLDDCARIVTRQGDVLEVELMTLGNEKITYKRCGKKDTFVHEINVKEVLRVTNTDGEILYQAKENKEAIASVGYRKYDVRDYPNARVHGMAIAFLVLGISTFFISVFILALMLGIIAIALGATARNQILKNPEQWKGKGAATAGMVLGIVATALLAIGGLALLGM
ncbi:MAG: DUF4190 domain-containing protein [Bacteroidota bacterium]